MVLKAQTRIFSNPQTTNHNTQTTNHDKPPLYSHQPTTPPMDAATLQGPAADPSLLRDQPFFLDDTDVDAGDGESLEAATSAEVQLIDELLGQLMKAFYLRFPEMDDEWDECSLSEDESEEDEDDDVVSDDAIIGPVDEGVDVEQNQKTIFALERIIYRIETED
ncbi:hypothetical protein BD779DRAFT_258631 [Infundibulicybe gibba]|nr:hypothetical protein BD779DRAFT_258631 [Infundibulicybe gibba]